MLRKPRIMNSFSVPVKLNLSRMGAARTEFSRLNKGFSKNEIGRRLLAKAKAFERRYMNLHVSDVGPALDWHKKSYLGAMMDYYNRFLIFAREQKASQRVIGELELHTHWLEKEYEKFAGVDYSKPIT